jgi:hypothetical protein
MVSAAQKPCDRCDGIHGDSVENEHAIGLSVCWLVARILVGNLRGMRLDCLCWLQAKVGYRRETHLSCTCKSLPARKKGIVPCAGDANASSRKVGC